MSIEKETGVMRGVLERAVGVVGTQTAREVGHEALSSIEQKYRKLEGARKRYRANEIAYKTEANARLSLYEAVVGAARRITERILDDDVFYVVMTTEEAQQVDKDAYALRSTLQALDEETT